jgi:hypothetical protein
VSEEKELLERILDYQRQTARSVADVALALNARSRLDNVRDEQTRAMLVTALTTVPAGHQQLAAPVREDEEEHTDKFKLIGKNQIELTRTTQRRIIQGVFFAVLWLLSHVVHFFVADRYLPPHNHPPTTIPESQP